MKKIGVAAFAIIILGVPLAGGAAVPAPPVNQNIGIPDTVFSAMNEADCRGCHNTSPPIPLVEPAYLPDRHHLLVGSAARIPGRSAVRSGAPGEPYRCLNCHTFVFDPATFTEIMIEDFRDCSGCHNTDSVHHITAQAQRGDCVACHGTVVNNGLLDADGDGQPDAAKWVPTYNPSLVTPAASKKPFGGPNGEGNCTFCHNIAPWEPNQSLSDDAFLLDPVSGVNVYTNRSTHHQTGFGSDDSKCFWCHSTESSTFTTMRRCENCHGIPSLHSIQADGPDADTAVTLGREGSGYGHVGSQDDCWGCHGFDIASGPTETAPTVSTVAAVTPTISETSTASVRAGSATTLVLTGRAFTNDVLNPATGSYLSTLSSKVVLADDSGNRITLEPRILEPTRLEVVLPPSLGTGSYRLNAVKGMQSSNPVIINVTPAVRIYSARYSNGTVTVRGRGFGDYPASAPGVFVDAGVFVKGAEGAVDATLPEAGEVVSWSPTQIVAKFPDRIDHVEVTSLFDRSSAAVSDSTSPRPGLGKRGRLGRVLTSFAKWRI